MAIQGASPGKAGLEVTAGLWPDERGGGLPCKEASAGIMTELPELKCLIHITCTEALAD